MTGGHKRNTQPMRQSLRCGAKTRKGTPCLAPAVKNKKRCRMHGGTQGSGAPKGNQNALKHGGYSQDTLEFQKHVRKLLKNGKEMIEEF